MAIKPDWTLGSLNLTAESMAFTTTGSALKAADIQGGDLLITQSGAVLVIEEITGENSGTLSMPCPPLAAGDNQPLRVRYQPDGSRLPAATRHLLNELSSGNVAAFAELVGQADMVPVFTGSGSITLMATDKLGGGAGGSWNATVMLLAGRDAYNDRTAGFRVMVIGDGAERSAIYEKTGEGASDWSAPVYFTGSQGSKGDIGERGLQGAQGIQGERGLKGDKGDTGAQGAKGDKGDVGATGAKGDKGDQGLKGDQGATGSQGTKGDVGERGIQGLKGDKGDQGLKGDRGSDFDPAIKRPFAERSNYNNQPEGFSFLATDRGELFFRETATVGVWSLPIPFGRGEKGDKGEQGSQGAQGLKGDKGDIGATGAKGDAGERGIQGLKGDKGDAGAAGLKGDKGDTGSQGIQGLKGDKGDIGPEGPKGDKGDQGVKGDQGATGAQGIKGDTGERGLQGLAGSNANVTEVSVRAAGGAIKTEVDGALNTKVNNSRITISAASPSGGVNGDLWFKL